MRIEPRIGLFVALTSVFVTSLVVGDVIGGKLVEVTLWGRAFTLSVGMIPFPVTFLLTDLLNEFYGKKAARFVTWTGFAMALFAYLLIYAAVALPFAGFTEAAEYTGVKKAAFDNVFAGSQRILLASMVAYLVAQFVDIGVFHALKRFTHNRFLWLRATGSTVVSQLVDTLVIQTVAWYGILSFEQILNVAGSSYLIKLGAAVGLTPVIYAGHRVLEKWLHMRPVELDDAGEPIEHAGDPIRAIDAARPD